MSNSYYIFTGLPPGSSLYPAIVWSDLRTRDMVTSLNMSSMLQARSGLPIATYFSAPKLRWLMDKTMLLLLMMGAATWQVRLLPCKSFLLTLFYRHNGLLANLEPG